MTLNPRAFRFPFRVLAALWLAVMGQAMCAHADWQLAWSDEFNGTALDANRWWADLSAE